jgi:hypothetical protein
MRPLKRFLVNGLSLALLTASVASLGMLGRSFYINDSAIYTNQYYVDGEFHRKCWLVESARGGLAFQFSTLALGRRRTVTELAQTEMFMHAERTMRTDIYPGFPEFYPNAGRGMPRFAGFIVGRDRFGNATAKNMRDGTFELSDCRGLTIPYWAISIIAAIWPLRAFYKNRRILRRKASRRCEFCGYDLRATPLQCPECGRCAKTVGGRGTSARQWLERHSTTRET